MFTRHTEVSIDLNRACVSLVRAVRPSGRAVGMSDIASLIDVRLAALEAKGMAPWRLVRVGPAGTAHECVLRRKSEDRLVSHTRHILAGPDDAIVVHDRISNAGTRSMDYVWEVKVRPGTGIACRDTANPMDNTDSIRLHHPMNGQCSDSAIRLTVLRWVEVDASLDSHSDAPCDRPGSPRLWSVGSGRAGSHSLVLRGPKSAGISDENDLYEHLGRLTSHSGI